MARGNKNKNKLKALSNVDKLALANLISNDSSVTTISTPISNVSHEHIEVNKNISKNNLNATGKELKVKEFLGQKKEDEKAKLINILDKVSTSVRKESRPESKTGAQIRNTQHKVQKPGFNSNSLIKLDSKNFATKTSSQIGIKTKKKLTKPTILELKTFVGVYPELVQDYDVDSLNPFTNALIKVNKNMVDIPKNWKERRGYLTSRSSMDKPNFELPDIILQTGIQDLRKINDPKDSSEKTGEGDNALSLKEDTRSKVQPKMNTLDLDYRKLYDVMFKIGSNWKPDYLLSYGDVYFENRDMNYSNSFQNMDRKFRPGKLSKNLQEALGYKSNTRRLPIWCIVKNDPKNKNSNSNNNNETMNKTDSFNNHYNLDVLNEIDKDGVYAQIIRKKVKKRKMPISKGQKSSKQSNKIELFGAKISTQEDSMLDEHTLEKNQTIDQMNAEEANTLSQTPLEQEDVTPNDENNKKSEEKSETNNPKMLYKVVEQKSIEGGKFIYDIKNDYNGTTTEDQASSDATTSLNNDKNTGEDKEFKF